MLVMEDDKRYEKLFKDITDLYGESQTTLLQTYWQTGKCIIETEQKSPARAGYGQYLIERLSNDLTQKYGKGFSQTNLKNMRRLFYTHPENQPESRLEWSKYLMLLSIRDNNMREELAVKAIDEGLTKYQLQKLVDLYMLRNRKESELERIENYKTDRGELYCYRMINSADLNGDNNEVLIDCGFNVWRNIKIENIDKYKDAEIFKTEKRNSKYYISEVLDKTKENAGKIYTYKGYVDSVVDGDTLHVIIDLGFETMIREKIRLRGIDAPEIIFTEGKKAKTFVVNALKNCGYIVLKTYKTDKYDRYVSDIFFMEGEVEAERITQEGELLNRKILDKGFARLAM